jgi:hypothetical protein
MSVRRTDLDCHFAVHGIDLFSASRRTRVTSERGVIGEHRAAAA